MGLLFLFCGYSIEKSRRHHFELTQSLALSSSAVDTLLKNIFPPYVVARLEKGISCSRCGINSTYRAVSDSIRFQFRDDNLCAGAR